MDQFFLFVFLTFHKNESIHEKNALEDVSVLLTFVRSEAPSINLSPFQRSRIAETLTVQKDRNICDGKDYSC